MRNAGVLNPRYIDGRSLGVKFCLGCGVKTSDYRYSRCRTCANGLKLGKKLTPEVKEKICKNLVKRYGSKSNFWIDGSSSLARLIRYCKANSVWRSSVFSRDNYTCQSCYKRGGYLQADHIIPFKDIFDEFLRCNSHFSPLEDKETLLRLSFGFQKFWDVDNGRTLCKPCHHKTDSFGYKGRRK